jgi:hypothetical protein
MTTSTPLHRKVHLISPRGELVMIGIDRVVVGRVISKRTKAVVPKTKNSLITTSGVSTAPSSVRWFHLARLVVGGGAA